MKPHVRAVQTVGETRHCWGRRRRKAKKHDKRLWKALVRLRKIDAKDAENAAWAYSGRRSGKVPRIELAWRNWDDWDEVSIRDHAWNLLAYDFYYGPDYDFLEKDGDPVTDRLLTRDDRVVLQILRQQSKGRPVDLAKYTKSPNRKAAKA